MFLEEVIVAIGEIGAVMAAAAFFACKSGTGHERCERVEVREFVIVARRMIGFRQMHSFQGCYGGRKFFAAAHDAYGAPHEIADLGKRGGSLRIV